ncbi:MAG TPA: heme-binding protein [Gammaproteobacteria bacterium]|nr:heme-binding protein [Gammaproteobacteria bacterium]
MKHLFFLSLAAVIMLLDPGSPRAADVLKQRNIGMELARDIASEAVLACRKAGYQVGVVVVDRGANVRAALRDDVAARFTLELAERKANMAIMSGVPTGEMVQNRADIRQELNQIEGLIMLRGGLPILVGGHRVGAVGVSGAPGGDKDEACARAALDELAERIEFAD